MTGLHVIHTITGLYESAGGPTRTTGALGTALARRGVAVDIIARGGDLLPDPALVTTRLTSDVGRAIDTARQRQPGVPAIVHDNGLWSASNRAAANAARARRLPYLVSVHGMLAPWALAHNGGRKRIAWAVYERRRLARAAGLLATAEAERADTRRHCPRIPIAIIPNGVDIPAHVTPRTPGTPPTLLFLSRLHPVKNLIALLDAWARIAAQHQFAAWRLRIAGPDENGHRVEVERHAAKLGIADRVDLTGVVADAAKGSAFADADVFVLPSLTENFGIVAAEALAHGLPVIATYGTPWAGLVDHACGWWVAPDAASLADAIGAALSSSAAERGAMGMRGRTWVADAFGWDDIAAQTEAFYEWTLHGGSRPDFVDA